MSFSTLLANSPTANIPFATKEDLCLAVDYILSKITPPSTPAEPERDYLTLAELCRLHTISYKHAKLAAEKLAAEHPHHAVQCSPNKFVYRADTFASALRSIPYRSRLNKKTN